MSSNCPNSTESNSIYGKSRSDTSLSSACIPSKVPGNEESTNHSSQNTPNLRTYSMGWLAKLVNPKLDDLAVSPKTCDIVSGGFAENKGSGPVYKNEGSVKENNRTWETKCITASVENVFYTRKLKLDKLKKYPPLLKKYPPLMNEPNGNKNQQTCIKPKKRKADHFDSGEDTQSKRRRELVDENNNLEDDELDAEVAVYMENGGPPTIWDTSLVDTPDLEPTQIYNNPSPWLRCIEGCFHSFRSPLGITKEPRKGAIRILDPWPCLHRNTKFGELKVVGELDLKKTPQHWKPQGN